MKRPHITVILLGLVSLALIGVNACDDGIIQSAGGVSMVTANIDVSDQGLTLEQLNVKHRLELENQLGSLKHLYIISAYSGDVILYSTVKGKVTSSGKRLTPSKLSSQVYGHKFTINGEMRSTQEVLGEDGTFGSSFEYIYWWDQRGVYHQHAPSGGTFLHISDQPVNFPKIIVNLEIVGATP